jgi:hypothetical protein
LADPKLDERQVLMAVLDHDPTLIGQRHGLTIIADKTSHAVKLSSGLLGGG